MITISSVEPLRTGAHGQGPGQHRGPQVEPGGLWNSFWSSFRRASGTPCLPLPGTASKEYEGQPFLTQHVMERGPSNRSRDRGSERLGERGSGRWERDRNRPTESSFLCIYCVDSQINSKVKS